MKKSSALTASPAGVAMRMRPPEAVGTVVAIAVLLADDTGAIRALTLTRLFASVGSKFVPVIVTAVPALPIVGVKLVIVGTELGVTVKDDVLDAVPFVFVTEMVPDVAPPGTVTVSFVAVAAVTVAAVPLNCTVLSPATALNAVPKIVTVEPTVPLFGVNSMIDRVLDVKRPIDRRFPTAS
jgi:hypothetical protein